MFAFTKNFVFLPREKSGGLAHLVERKVRNLKVAGSSPVTSTKTIHIVVDQQVIVKGLTDAKKSPAGL